MFSELWVDKYKPNNLNEITGNVEIIERLKIISKSRNFKILV